MSGIRHTLHTGHRPLDQRLAQRGLGARLMAFLLSARMTPLQQARFSAPEGDIERIDMEVTEQGRDDTSPRPDDPAAE